MSNAGLPFPPFRIQKTSAPCRPWGFANTIGTAGTGTGPQYWELKMQAEAPAKRFRMFLFNRNSAIGTQKLAFSIAPTERFDRSTITSAWDRWEGGSLSNVFSSGTVPNGFRVGSWQGAGVSPSVGQGSLIAPSFGLSTSNGVASDWLEIGALAAVDFGNKNAYAYLLKLAANANAADNQAIEYVSSSITNYLMTNWDADPKGYRYIAGNSTPWNPVTDPTVNPNDASWWSTIPNIGWEFDYGVDTKSVYAVGDSITEGYKWPFLAIHRKSTPTQPWDVMNCGGSSTRSKDFFANMWSTIQICGLPNFVMFPSMSVNNYSPLSLFTMQAAQFEVKRILEIVNQLANLGVMCIIWTCYNFGVDTDINTPIGYVNNAVRQLCNNGKATLMDVNRDSRMNRTIYDATTNPTGFYAGDGTHPSDPYGINLLASLLSETIANF